MRQEGERSALRSALWPKGYTYSTGARESHLYTVAHLRLDRPSSAAHNRKSDSNKTRIPARAAGLPRYTRMRHGNVRPREPGIDRPTIPSEATITIAHV